MSTNYLSLPYNIGAYFPDFRWDPFRSSSLNYVNFYKSNFGNLSLLMAKKLLCDAMCAH